MLALMLESCVPYHRTRFAPAPTGYLHLGHVVNALEVWGVARQHGAEVVLRIEDHDRQRCRPEYEAALLEDLEWLGFVPDQPSFADLRHGSSPWRQSDSSAVYQAALDRLRQRGHHMYYCDCSRSTVAAGEEPLDPNTERPYPGRCRYRGLGPGPDRGLRLLLPAAEQRFDDLRVGGQVQLPAEQCGDLLLRDRRGNWTYQFAVVVDDERHGIDLVIRGEDLLTSTGRQLQLGSMLGRGTPPAYLHHTLIRKPGGEKLSKGNRDTGVRELRMAGRTPDDVLEMAKEAAARR
jgi:glutamyl-tRNA synthetase/glutamyl-Q tRNA(Asp) synthetase